jgi:hypothetical protein
MNTLSKRRVLIILFMSLMLQYGCIKEEDLSFDKVASNSWNPEFAVPLIHSHLSINDITGMTDTGMFTVNNHQISLVYKTNIYSLSGYEFFTPVNQSAFQTLQMFPQDSVNLYQNDSVTQSISVPMPFTFPNNEQIDSLTFRKGSLRISLTSNIPHDAVLNVSIPSATLNGQSFSQDIPVNASYNQPEFGQGIFDMSGYHMKTTNGGMPNMLNISYSIKFRNSGTTSPALGKNFDITTAFDSITPASMFGFLGQREFNMPSDSAEISIFNNFQGGSMFFDDPKMTISLYNSFGMPIDAQIGTLSAIQSNGTVTPVTGPYPPQLIDYPIVFGQAATNSFTFDKTNSNIQQIFNSSPHYFVYNIAAGTNSPLPVYNFMGDSSNFRADLKLEFPLKGYTTGFAIQDTVDFGIGNIDMLKSATFKLNISNGFPMHVHSQLYFVDDNNVVLDSMFAVSQDRILESAAIDANGRVTIPTVRSDEETFDEIRLPHIFNAKKIIIRGVIDTKDAPTTSVELFDDYKLDFKIGVKTKLKIDF